MPNEKTKLRPGVRNAQRKRYYDRHRYSVGRRPWTLTDIQTVMDHKKPDTQIAREIGRTVLAVQVKRCEQNKRLRAEFGGLH